MGLTLSDLKGVVAYPKHLDTYLENGNKAATGVLAAGLVVVLTDSSGIWTTATSDDAKRAGVVPKLYWGSGVNTASSTKILVLTGGGAEVYVEAAGAIKPGARVQTADAGKVKAWATGKKAIGVYKGHYGEGIGFDQHPTDAANGEAVRIQLLEGDDVT